MVEAAPIPLGAAGEEQCPEAAAVASPSGGSPAAGPDLPKEGE